MATLKKTKPRRDRTGAAEYQRAIKQLAKVLARWIEEDGGQPSLDDYLTEVAEDLETLVNEGGAR